MISAVLQWAAPKLGSPEVRIDPEVLAAAALAGLHVVTTSARVEFRYNLGQLYMLHGQIRRIPGDRAGGCYVIRSNRGVAGADYPTFRSATDAARFLVERFLDHG